MLTLLAAAATLLPSATARAAVTARILPPAVIRQGKIRTRDALPAQRRERQCDEAPACRLIIYEFS